MSKILNSRAEDFISSFQQLLTQHVAFSTEIDTVAHSILEDIRREGDTALLRYTKEFDHHSAIIVQPEEIAHARKICPPTSSVSRALEEAKARITAYHQAQMPHSLDYTDAQGVRLGNLWRPVQTVGMYVPGGRASYPSSVLMNAIPALVAGVKRLVMVVPAPNNELNPAILVAADMLGIKEIFKVGGAQAIAALTYGTGTIPAVDKIVGPGNAFVASAKRQVFGQVGIDMVAGPSEILVVADATQPPEWVAADLLSQAEHDTAARSLLITTDEAWAHQVLAAINAHLVTLERRDIASKSWHQQGAIILVDTLENAVPLINQIAPEHLQLMMPPERYESMLPRIYNAGAIFLGNYTPEAIGDYIAGPSHVLPTSGTARFSSGLSVYDFLKRISLIGCAKDAFNTLAPATETLAKSEGLDAHALSITLRR